jgi:hypothetical protein
MKNGYIATVTLFQSWGKAHVTCYIMCELTQRYLYVTSDNMYLNWIVQIFHLNRGSNCDAAKILAALVITQADKPVLQQMELSAIGSVLTLLQLSQHFYVTEADSLELLDSCCLWHGMQPAVECISIATCKLFCRCH